MRKIYQKKKLKRKWKKVKYKEQKKVTCEYVGVTKERMFFYERVRKFYFTEVNLLLLCY